MRERERKEKYGMKKSKQREKTHSEKRGRNETKEVIETFFSRICPQVSIPTACNNLSVTFPIPGILRTARGARNSRSLSRSGGR
jgi:hypothetical protein